MPLAPLQRAILVTVACGLMLTACRKESSKFPAAPVILISIDTLRADRLPAYGSTRVKTPAIDRLAAEGILFENAYAHVPLTLPSHVTMMSGSLPWQTGVRSNIGFRFDPKGSPTLPKLLSGAGYATAGVVSSYVLRAETGMGPLFDVYDDSIEVTEASPLGALQRDGDDAASSALRWIDGVREQPFFLFLHFFEPHTPYEPAEPFRSQYADPYDGEIATVDAILGRFLAELDRRGLYDDAMIVLVSDHGEGLGDHREAEHGVLLYREVLHVPMVIKLPKRRLAGRRVSAPVQILDLLPTITGAVGAEVPPAAAGTSLIELAEGRGPSARTIYSETLYPRLHLGWSQLRSLTDARHHYIESPAPELFDVAADPREKHDLRDQRRREAHAFAEQLAGTPLNLVQPASGDPEERARLAALGYLSGASSSGDGPLRNPREHIEVLARVQEAFALYRKGRPYESAELCRDILRDYPDLVDVYTQLAASLRRMGRLQEARDAYHQAVRRSPQLIDSMAIEIAKVELDLGNLEAAELNARQAMKLNPAEAHLILAGAAMQRRDWSAAEREALLAQGNANRPRVPALILLARALVEQGKLREALAAADRAGAGIQEDGAPVATLASTRGDILGRMGRNAEAEAAFREEIARFPSTREAYVRLAVLLAAQHRFSEIVPTLESMIKASPMPATYRLAAQAMSDLGNDEGARAFRSRGERRAAELRQGASPPG